MASRTSLSALKNKIKALEQEVAELKRSEQALRESRESYRMLFEHAADVIAVLDTKGTLLDLNAMFEDVSGYTRGEMIGKNVFECGIMTETSARNLRARLKAMLAGEPWRVEEIEGVRKGGEIVPYEVNAIPITKNGNLVAVQAICRDISDRRQTEQAFRRENEKFQLLVETSPSGVSIINRKGRYTYINSRFTEMVGYTLEDIPDGRAWFEKAFPDENLRKEVMAVWIQDLKNFKRGKFRPRTYPVTCKDGSQKIVTMTSVTLEMGDQFVIYEDNSERMAAMEVLRESQERYQSVFENTGTAMGIFEEDMTISMANTGLERLTGYPKAELEGKMKWTQFVAEGDLDRMVRYHNQRRKEAGEAPAEYEFRLIDRDGNAKDIFIKAELLPGTRKSIASMVDITARKRSEEALQRSEERYRTILESIEEGYFEVDLKGNLTFYNDALCRISGYPPEQMLGLNNKSYTTPESAKRMYQVFNQVYRTGRPVTTTDHEIIRSDGGTCILAISASRMEDSSGNPVGFRGLVRDITERKRAEKALRESEEKYRQLMEHAPAGIYEVDFKEQKFVTANDVMCEYTGYTKEEFLSLSPMDILTEDSRKLFLERMSRAFSGEEIPETVEFSIRAKGGREFWVILNTRYVYENGLPKGATVVVHDITERKLAEEALRKSEERYRLLVDHANDGIFIAQDGKIKFPNPKTIEVLGYTADELADIRYRDLIHPEDWALFLERQKKDPGGDRIPGTYSLRVVNKRGEEIWAQINAVPINWEGREATLNFVRDITPQKRLEAQLLHAQKMEAIGTIAGGVAHNFRNILAVISMKSQLIQMKFKGNPALEEVASGIDTYIERGVHLVEGLMQFCRRESKTIPRPVNLSEVLLETYQLISKSFDKMIEIHLDVPESLPVMGDDAGLIQVFMNLCTNARDAMPRGGQLRIEARQEGEQILVTLSDTGEGMDKKTQDKCFDPFFTTKEPDKGTGLGLSTTYGIVREHNGNIQVHSGLGQGTSFMLTFPLAPTPEQPSKQNRMDTAQGGGQKILIVDDEIDICRVMKELLNEYGYHVAYVTSGKAAISEYKNWQPDIMLLDRNMPEMDGMSVAEQIVDYDPKAKIVVISGYDENGPLGIEAGKKKYIKGYLSKPINIKELSALLTNML